VCHGDCHQPHHLDAHLHIFEVCKFCLFEVVPGTPSQDVRPGSSFLKVQLNDAFLLSFANPAHCRAVIIKLVLSGLLAG
jgi:hypothetical protein